MTRSLRFGLAGTGRRARITHAPALASTDGIEFAGLGVDPAPPFGIWPFGIYISSLGRSGPQR